MIKLYTLLFISCTTLAFAQNMDWQWANEMPSVNTDLQNVITTDTQGNVYSFATFSDATVTVGNTTLTNPDATTLDAYFVKYNAQGQQQWVKQIGGTGSDDIYCVTTDSSGNVYVCGIYRWNGATFGNQFFPGTGTFLAKYDTNGNFIWVKTGDAAWVYNMIISPGGEIYLGGTFASSFSFGGATLTGQTDTSNIFISKLDSDGNAIWAKKVDRPAQAVNADPTANQLSSMAIDSLGNVYFTGLFSTSTITFDNIVLDNPAFYSMCLAKYNADGTVAWAKCTGNYSCAVLSYSVATDAFNNVYVSGTYCGEAQFGSITLNAPYGNYANKTFVAKFDTDGTALWAKSSAGGFGRVTASVTDSNNNLYVAGNYTTPLTFDGTTVTTDFDALFIAKYDPDGNVTWTKSTGAQNVNSKTSLALLNDTTLYVAGYMSYTELQLGNITLENDPNHNNIFVTKLSDSSLSVQNPETDAMVLYPNPAKDNITVKAGSPIQSITVHDTNGRIVAQSFNNPVINISTVANGIYFLTATTNTGSHTTKKIIKQ